MASVDKKDKLTIGQRISWHTRPEVHVDHGGYLTTKPHIGVVRSVCDGFVMVGTGKVLGPHIFDPKPQVNREERLAVELTNPSIKLLDDELDGKAIPHD